VDIEQVESLKENIMF